MQMFPIIGKRYKCLDCKEAVGFDLCENCYDTRSKLPGRFNQQHTPEHRFVLVHSYQPHDEIMRIATRMLEDFDSSGFLNDGLEELGNIDATN